MLLASNVAEFLQLQLIGEDISVYKPTSLDNMVSGSIVFAKKYDEEIMDVLNRGDVLALVTSEYIGKISCPHIVSDNPRLSMAKVIDNYFRSPSECLISGTAIIESSVVIGENVSIGEYCVIKGDVVIGDNTRIGHHVCISGKTRIGNNCWIKSGAVIGEEGFGFERDKNDINVHFPQIGDIVIGNNVFIGANSTIERAALDSTIIEDGVAVDDLTQVGHNVRIGKGSTLACGAVLCGGVQLGERCAVAPNACIRQKLIVGDDTVIGLGAVVVKNVPGNAVYIGNPAHAMGMK